jgi:hypothetical protein
MFGTIRKHQTWLWAVIITVIVISFVIYFSPYSKLNNARTVAVNLGSINGESVSEDQFVHARNEVVLRHFFMTGSWPDDDARRSGGQVDRDTYQWLLLIQKQKQMNIHFSPSVAAGAARAMVSHFEQSGIDSPEAFIRQVLLPRGLNVDDLERFVHHFLGVQELIATVGVAGALATPAEVESLYKREHEELSTEAAFFSATNYLNNVTVLPDAVAQYYTNRQALYRIPDRVQVSYVRFDFTNYAAEAAKELAGMTNLDTQIEAAWRQGGTNFLRQVDAQTIDEAKTKLRSMERRRIEAKLALGKARDFADPLFDLNPLRAEDLDKMAKDKGLTVGVTAPFETNNPPADLGVSWDFATKAFSRKPADPFAGPILGSNAVYIIAYKNRLPSEIPPLDQIRPQVVKDFRKDQALSLARQAGMDFYQTLTNSMAQGKTFAAACTAAKVTTASLPPLSISTRTLPAAEEHLSLNQLKQLAFTTPPGKVSNFQMTSEGGVILYVKAKLPLDPTKMKDDLPTFTRMLRQNRQNEAFNDWFRREAEKGLRDTPLLRQQQPPNMGPAAAAKKP